MTGTDRRRPGRGDLAPDWLERQADAARRHVESLPPGLRDHRAAAAQAGPVARDGSPLEARLVELATAVGLCAARARLEMPALSLARVRRALDAALALAHATERLVEALGAEELAADERSLLTEMRNDRLPGEEP